MWRRERSKFYFTIYYSSNSDKNCDLHKNEIEKLC